MPVYKASSSLTWISFLAIAMAFVESAVVVYLRALYYPGGFDFPMVPMPHKIALTEILREIATLIMLLAMGHLAGTTARQRFAWFIYSFATWDLFYYVFLKLLIDWPSSWFTWDILFLVPIVWTGPVLAPILVALTMIILAFTILYFNRRYEQLKINRTVILCIILGSILIFLSFTWDYASYLIRHYSVSEIFKSRFASGALYTYIPVSFNWFLLLAGEISIFSGILLIIFRNRITNKGHVQN